MNPAVESSSSSKFYASNGLVKDLILGICGLVTSVITGLLLWGIETKLDFDVHSYMILFIVPIGAGIAGFVGASGYYLGARLFQCRPTLLLGLGVMFISVGTYFLVHYLSYTSLEVQGRHVSDFVSFGEFMDTEIRSTSIQFLSHGARPIGETGMLGGWGYGLAAIQILGFACGGLVVISMLMQLPYCEQCSRYFSSKGQQTRYSGSSDATKQIVQQVAEDFRSKQLVEALQKHQAHGTVKPAKTDTFKSVVGIRYCSTCGKHFGRLQVYKKNRNEWSEISELAMDCRTDQIVTV